jgi:hypothetical protein
VLGDSLKDRGVIIRDRILKSELGFPKKICATFEQDRRHTPKRVAT